MAEGRLKAEWGRTSTLLCLLANLHRDPKERRQAFRPRDFDPFASANGTGRDAPHGTVTMAELKARFPRLARDRGRKATTSGRGSVTFNRPLRSAPPEEPGRDRR